MSAPPAAKTPKDLYFEHMERVQESHGRTGSVLIQGIERNDEEDGDEDDEVVARVNNIIFNT